MTLVGTASRARQAARASTGLLSRLRARLCPPTGLAVAACVALSGRGAAAQLPDSARATPPGDSTLTLPTVRIMGSILPLASPRVGSGVPARIAVVPADEVRAWKPRLLSELLARQPGGATYDDLGSLSKTTLVIRGFTASPVVGLPQGVSVFLDGVPVNEPDAGQVNFDLLPLDQVERIEVLSGTASLLGPHSLGGAVNLITTDGSTPRGEIEVAGGSHESYSTAVSYGAESPGGVRYYGGGGYSREGGWRQLTEARHLNGLVNVGRFGERAGFRFQALAANGYAETAGSLPVSVYRVRPDSNLSSGDFEDINQIHLALSGYRTLGGGQGSATVHFRQSDAERFNVNQATDPDVRSFSDNRSIGASADWQAERPVGDATLDYRVGVGGSANRSRVRIYGERIDPGLTTDVESPIAKLDAYAIAGLTLNRVSLSAGLRYDLVRIPFRNRIDPMRDTTSTFRRLSPRGGVSVALGGGGSVWVSLGQSFRPPALIELACADPEEPCPLPFALGDDPPLDPVVATTVEAGGRWLFGPALVTASAYRTDVRDDIFLFPYSEENEPAGSTIDGYFANITKTRREGLELGARVALGRLALHATHGVSRATFQVDDIEIFSIREVAGLENEVSEGDRLPLVPARVSSLGASAALPGALTLGVDARHTGRRYLRGDEANEEAPLEPHWVTDARVAMRRGLWDVSLVVRNIFDSHHATFGTFNINQGDGGTLERFLTPGAPRSVRLLVRRAW